MNLRPEEISTLIKDQIKNYRTKIEPAETGTVILFGDGIAKAHGLRSCVSNELLEFVGLLASFTFFVDPVVYLCQRLVAVGIGVDIGISAVRSGFLQYMAVAPNEASMVFEVD